MDLWLIISDFINFQLELLFSKHVLIVIINSVEPLQVNQVISQKLLIFKSMANI
jgi:hypothetical protein